MKPSFLLPVLPLSGAVFSILADLISTRTGLNYDDTERELLATKLSPLVAERGLDDFLDYYYLLKYDGTDAQAEWSRLQSALAVNETYFWRESEQLQAVASGLATHRRRAGLRIWHAGCCTGEEPYSMAIALLSHGIARYSIMATDANQDSIDVARRGVYRARSFRALPEPLKERYFTAVDGGWAPTLPVLNSVTFRCSNLADEKSWSAIGEQDVIFCRNVFIYFTDAAILKVVRRFHHLLAPGGYLFLGASESLLRYDTSFKFVELGGAIGYRKAAA